MKEKEVLREREIERKRDLEKEGLRKRGRRIERKRYSD